jgi:hypothetical protein
VRQRAAVVEKLGRVEQRHQGRRAGEGTADLRRGMRQPLERRRGVAAPVAAAAEEVSAVEAAAGIDRAEAVSAIGARSVVYFELDVASQISVAVPTPPEQPVGLARE